LERPHGFPSASCCQHQLMKSEKLWPTEWKREKQGILERQMWNQL
jgi:hypothetical protein